MKSRDRIPGLLVLLCAIALPVSSQTPIPGKFYEYYVIARTGGSFTDLGAGSGPSINDVREVAFRAATASGNSLWFGTGNVPPVNFNPGESNSGSDTIHPSVQINANHQVVGKDSISTTSPATTAVRLYDATTADSFIYAARGGPLHNGIGTYLYDAVFANPVVNINGDVVFTAQYNSQAPFKVLGYLAHGSTTPVEQAIRSGNPKPMIADSGHVVIQVGGSGGQTNNQILVYPPGLGNPIVIADTANNWTSLDNDPGISRDGRIIAFQGNPNAAGATAIGTTVGPGVFVAIDEGTGFANAKILRITGTKVEDVAADRAASRGNFDGVCDPGEICKPAAELGFDNSGNPITIASYGSDSRVGVVNVDFGAAGIDDDSFVISFIATPSSASRDNPALVPGTPLLFSAQQGLWTIRVDVQHQLAGAGARVYHPFTPIPVVQLGDRLGPDTITGIGVYDPIANAAHDENGAIRTMRRGDHRVAFWASTNSGQIIVRGNHLDSDQDGLLDHWETTGIDMDQDGIVDLKLSDYGADPFTRDLFLQVDWVGKPGTDLFKPAGAVFPSDVAGAYSIFEANLRNAETLSGPMYGVRLDDSPPADIRQGVVPHVDAGNVLDSLFLPMSINLGTGTARGGNYIGMPGNPATLPQVVYFGQPGLTFPGVNIRSFQDIKDSYLGTADKDARLLAFHYMVFAPFQDFAPNYPSTPYTATVTGGDQFSVEVDQPLAFYPKAVNGTFLLMTSGNAVTDVRQIKTTSTDGGNGKGIYNLSSPLSVAPAIGDTLTFLDGSTGLSEVAFAPSPDNNSLPGNDVIVSAGSMGVLQGVPANMCLEGETASHELGHTLGLRHGGTDHNAYKPGPTYVSVMSYTWQLDCSPTPATPDYSQNGDPTFDDYAHLQFNFSDVQFHLSTSLGEARGEGYPADMQQQDPEQNMLDVIARNGPLDTVPPTITITSPVSGGNVALGGNLVVNITASDNVAISRVSVAFDTNGNGVTDAGEAINATSTGGNTYQATFANVGGAAGSRALSAIAWDSSSNNTRAAISIVVGTVQVAVPNVVGLTQAAATTAITGAGLVVGTVTTASSNTVASGSVISENPAAGTQVNSGSAVNLVVSSGPAQVAVPNVVGLTQAAATTAITGAGLVVGTVTTASSNTVASGSVISENPAAGTQVNSGSAVNLVVSTGPAQVAVPNVVGLTQAAATTAITGAGLVVGTVTTASSNTVASGSVISENPAAGAQVNSGSAVNLVVSSGPAQVAVPNVVGLTQAAATTAITGAGLVVGTVTTASSNTVASGSVISENPAAGTQINSGSAVNLVVSTGPAQVAVPNVVGLTQAAATTAITGAGLVVGTVTTASSNTVASGSVISENPAAGTQVNSGSAVNLVVSSGPAQVAVPNVVGLTQAAATTAITGAGLVVGTVTTASSNTVASGSVISENPAAGAQVNSGSAVNLVVSTGPAQVAVPNVVGLTQAAATTAITGAGLVVGTVTTASSNTVASGSVISENPAAGTQVNSGSAVNLVVSSGVAPPVTITVGTSPAGLSFTVDSITYTSAHIFQWIVGSSHTLSTTTPQGSSPEYDFSGWSDGGSLSHNVITPSTANTYTASFNVTQISQTINFPAIPDQLFGTPPFALTATASSGLPVAYRLMSGPATILGNVITLTGIGPVTINASQLGNSTYAQAPDVLRTFNVFSSNFTLTLAANPSNGGVIAASPTATAYAAGTSVQLTAQPNAGFIFTGFSGDLSGLTNPQAILMSQAHTVAANFAPLSTDPQDQLAFGFQTGNALPASQTIPLTPGSIPAATLSADQQGPSAAAVAPSVQVIPGTGGAWLNATLTPATNPTAVQFSLAGSIVTALPTGTYSSYAIISTASGQRILTIKLLVNSVSVTRVVDSAGYQSHTVAPSELMTVFGINEATQTAVPLAAPQPSLGGTAVTITDSAGVTRSALLSYVSPTQINLLTPAGMASGPGTLTVIKSSNQQATQAVTVGAVSPGLFSADMTGTGVAAAGILRIAADGTRTTSLAANCVSGAGCTAVPIDVSDPTVQVYLSLYGTGIRGRSALSQVMVTVGGVPLQPAYAGDQLQYAGMDQVNILLPPSLAGKGNVAIVTTVDGQPANTVTITLK